MGESLLVLLKREDELIRDVRLNQETYEMLKDENTHLASKYMNKLEKSKESLLVCRKEISQYFLRLNMENNNWIPVSSGLFPDDMENVQVTFIGYNDHATHCEGFAYRNKGDWYWTLNDGEVKVEITAWKKNCEPYKAE